MRGDKAVEVIAGLLLGLAALFGLVASGVHHGAEGWWWATKGCATGAVFIVLVWFVLHPLFVWAGTQKGEWLIAAARRRAEQAQESAAIRSAQQPATSRQGITVGGVVATAPGELRVVHASYFAEGGGFDDKLADLLNRLRSEDGRRLRFSVTNQVLGDGNPTYDPAPGVVKTLQITYVRDGESRTVQIQEGQEVDLP